MTTIYIVPIEPIDQRYTKQWYDNIPTLLKERMTSHDRPLYDVVTIDGEQPKTGTTQGAFLDFAVTNLYKASQVQRISQMFADGEIKAGDKFLVTDAWNFAITAIRYMSDLLEIPVEIHGIWHAGAYDPTDILGMKMGKTWSHHQEKAWYYACDYNYFATNFHKNMFLKNLDIGALPRSSVAIRSGQPHTPIITQLTKYYNDPKINTVMWPHRYNADKQPEIAEDMDTEFAMLITQKLFLNKSEYYACMGKAKIIFSCALHENLGISVMEGTLAGAIPVVPDRASYKEMYMDEFKYPGEWTASFESYQKHKVELFAFIQDRITNREKYLPALEKQRKILMNEYLSAGVMLDKLLEK